MALKKRKTAERWREKRKKRARDMYREMGLMQLLLGNQVSAPSCYVPYLVLFALCTCPTYLLHKTYHGTVSAGFSLGVLALPSAGVVPSSSALGNSQQIAGANPTQTLKRRGREAGAVACGSTGTTDVSIMAHRRRGVGVGRAGAAV